MCFYNQIVYLQSRKDNTRHAIRADKDTQAMLRIERQFTAMTVMIVLVVGIILSITTFKDYQLERMVKKVQNYFNCLKVLMRFVKNKFLMPQCLFVLYTLPQCNQQLFRHSKLVEEGVFTEI